MPGGVKSERLASRGHDAAGSFEHHARGKHPLASARACSRRGRRQVRNGQEASNQSHFAGMRRLAVEAPASNGSRVSPGVGESIGEHRHR